MNMHKRIIGICWLLIGVLLISLLATSIGSAEIRVLVIGSVISLVYFAAGLALLANMQRAVWLYLSCAVLSLFTFPVGTVIGAYYFWYYFTREKPRP